ncbi:MAG: CDP-diacylglycerol---serine O-phosphatidyltransferase [Candidatus Petromonas sp.]|jgi:CDP-diacylglycerol--serine O-phosphatidyltransferase|nr:CDP-diacylglycerol---serine O-phosphatidyltransferase [Candidatus Petromonas sp.]
MKYKEQIPNLFTSINLVMGIMAIIFMFSDRYLEASLLILVAVFLDRMDGNIARKLDVVSDFGKELDSLCDLISFGVAPSLLIWNIFLENSGLLGIVITLLFALAGAFRLARYNITEFDGFYTGIPITICGGLVALISLVLINHKANINLIMLFMLFLSYAMISKRIRLKKR